MKVAIEKALANNMLFGKYPKDLKVSMKLRKIKDEHYVFSIQTIKHSWDITKSIYGLIFGTDFIECLVGRPEKTCCNCSLRRTKIINGKTHCDRKDYIEINTDCDIFWLDESEGDWQPTEYHRAQMANLKDIEKLKEYVRKLI